MRLDGNGLAWIFKDDDWTACADNLTTRGYQDEFTLSACLDAETVEGSCLAGFMPMSARFAVPAGFPYGEHEPSGLKNSYPEAESQDDGLGSLRVFLTPKLHLERCILDPDLARVTVRSQKEARHYKISMNLAFDQVLSSCVETHGDAWLTPPLARVFSELHKSRSRRQIQFVSIELWRDETLAAGEFGYATGGSYASLSGFRKLSGAGTVQLAALAGILAGAGIRAWDLGMPMGYKTALGGRSLGREEYLPILRRAYQVPAETKLGEVKDADSIRFRHTATEL